MPHQIEAETTTTEFLLFDPSMIPTDHDRQPIMALDAFLDALVRTGSGGSRGRGKARPGYRLRRGAGAVEARRIDPPKRSRPRERP
jgi:hypothetical protein